MTARKELAAVGYRQLDFASLTPADGYLATFTPPESLLPAGAIRPCRQEAAAAGAGAISLGRLGGAPGFSFLWHFSCGLG